MSYPAKDSGGLPRDVLDDHDAALLDFRVAAHAFPALAAVKDFFEFTLHVVQVEFPRAVRGVEVAGVLLHVALEGAVEAIGDAAGLHEADVGEGPRYRASAHVEYQERLGVGILFHGELPTEILPAGAQVKDTAVRIRRVFLGITLDVHVERAGLVGLRAHAEYIGDAVAQYQVLLELQAPGFLARLLDVEAYCPVVRDDFGLAAPEVGSPAVKRVLGGEIAVLDDVRAASLGAGREVLVLDEVRDDARVLDAERAVDGDFLAPADKRVVRAVLRHVHFGAVGVARAPAPAEPPDAQAFAFAHDVLVGDFAHSGHGHRGEFAHHERDVRLDRFFKAHGNALGDAGKARSFGVVAFAGPPHVDGEQQVVFRVRLQELRADVEQVLLVLAPVVGVDHDGHADCRRAHLGDNQVVDVEEFLGRHFMGTGFVAHVEDEVFLMVVDHLEHFIAQPEIDHFGQLVPVAGGVVQFDDGDHPVADALGDDGIEVADAPAGVPDDADAVSAGLRHFGNRFAFAVGPDEHVVYAAQDDLLVVLAVEETVLHKETWFGGGYVHA